MRSHCALYVDAGYLLAAAATRATGTSLRKGIVVDHEKLILSLVQHAETRSGLPLLRVHWYDSARNSVPDSTQEAIGLLDRVKLRLGRVGYDGEQKGVDLRIGLDMVAHARNGAIDAMYLVSGDDDLAEAVEEAQAQGAQVTLLGVPTNAGRPHGMSKHLQQSSDGLDILDAATLDATVTRAVRSEAVRPTAPGTVKVAASIHVVPSPAELAGRRPTQDPKPAPTAPVATVAPASPPSLVYSGTTGESSVVARGYSAEDEKTVQHVVDRVVSTWLSTASSEQRSQLTAGRPSVPRELDRALLLDAAAAFNSYDLDEVIRQQLRARFWDQIDVAK